MSKWLMLFGLLIFAIGVLMHFAPWALNWFGKLPGDIRVEGEKGSLFFPVTSMIIVSVILSVLFSLFRR